MSEEARERKRQLMARKLAAATGRHMPGAPRAAAPSKPPPREATPETRKQALRGLASSLKETATFTGGVDLAQRYLEEAKRLEEAGNLVQAANALRLAVALAPDRRDVHEQHDRVARLVARDLADDYAKQAEYEEQNEKWADAALSWARVCEGRPHDGQAHLRAAKCLFQLGKDLQKAKSFAQRAVELLPDEAESHKQLGLVYHAAGMKLNARRALELAIELDPKDEMVENLLRELSK
jgi:tetratricopeptide (TPR) repeat protein